VEFLRRNQRLFYWKNGTEIDFVLRIGRQADELVNVCYSLNKRTLAREIESLERGLSEFKEAKAKLIYWEGKPVKHDKIEFQNILDFLLASAD
jgi:predicted AAA+ superfamily ATPase